MAGVDRLNVEVVGGDLHRRRVRINRINPFDEPEARSLGVLETPQLAHPRLISAAAHQALAVDERGFHRTISNDEAPKPTECCTNRPEW